MAEGRQGEYLADEQTPPPPLQMLQKLQLFRTTLVNFIEWKTFEEVVRGCFVRVLLEMRSEDVRRDNSDHYYIACVKGARRGPKYSGFSADMASTEWHIVIELPPCFRATQNGNVVQLNSISNSPFRQSEYQQWIEMTREAGHPFISLPQLHFRLDMLEEHKQQALAPEQRRKRHGEDPQTAERRERALNVLREQIKAEVINTHVQMPTIGELQQRPLEQLQEIEREMLELISRVRMTINERSKCMICRRRLCTVICYPCKHQVLCKDCAEHIHGKCPVQNCNIPVQEHFEAYTS
ncbi:Plus-3 domain [Trypanosoma melophagium]|uniref:Plus-3 domain n=1 Tax=Trypanosoma melophagium TaxID=715481 RepID=UPI00351A0A6D|nr:Plus-3 domain [Trypanosoma melophagium]